LTDHAYVAQHPAFVWHHTRPADHFQIGHFREVTQDLVLHAIGEISVLFVVTEILERQDGDRFLRRTLCDWLHRHWLLRFFDELFKARIAAQRIPERQQFQSAVTEAAWTANGAGKLFAGEISVTNPCSDHGQILDHGRTI